MGKKVMIGEILRRLRKDNNHTQHELAKLIGISRASYLTYENGRNKIPLETAIDLAKALEVPLEVIAGIKSLDGFLERSTASALESVSKKKQILEEHNIEQLRLIALELLEAYGGLFEDYATLKSGIFRLVNGK